MTETAAPAAKTDPKQLTDVEREQLKRDRVALRVKRATAAERRLKNRDKTAERRRDTHFKIVIGALLIADAHDHAEVAKYLSELIARRAPPDEKSALKDYLAGVARKKAEAAQKAAARPPAAIEADRATRAADRARKAAEAAARLADQKARVAQAAALKAAALTAAPAPGARVAADQPVSARDAGVRLQPSSDRPAPASPQQQAAPSQAPVSRPQEPPSGAGYPAIRPLPPRGS